MNMEGIVLVDKPSQVTSRDVVNKLNHLLGTKKIGHTGTLDPLATGVLVCPIGPYTKLVNDLTSLDKEYIASIKLGIKTDTGDITGNILEEKTCLVKKDEVLNIFRKMLGMQIQTVPIYSAVKINGKKLYEYAREHIEVELPKREIEIFSLELIKITSDEITFKTRVSKGTYIRSLIEDICSNLKIIGTMSSLIRTKQGAFSLDEAYTLEDIENNHYKLLSASDIFDYPLIEVDDELYTKIKNGAKLKNTFHIKDKVIFTYKAKDIAIYKVEEALLKSYIQL